MSAKDLDDRQVVNTEVHASRVTVFGRDAVVIDSLGSPRASEWILS